jgi:hypothetical protein
VQVVTTTFEYHEVVDRSLKNVVEGLELHEHVLSPAEQQHLENEITGWAKEGAAVHPYITPPPSDFLWF